MACTMCIVAGLMVSLSDPNGPINSKYTFFQRFLPFKGATSNLEPAAGKRVGPALGALWGHFGVTLGLDLVSVGDLASLDGHFAIIVESLWVYKGPFSKNAHFSNIS